ncbi:uncharacterized protein LOC124413225 [Diprion similis]|uniref:uncharacterized protein LOC124413225 n=1 Tax=Diprion similis TaxID=362088 RepID=UPI001EF94653|nr:uncharacterized protein LOC124413225 [Diprion similis]
MISLCEDAAPGSGSLLDEINTIACDLASFVLATLGFLTSNATSTSARNEEDAYGQQHQTLLELCQEFSAWLAFDEFQLQLFKLFALILVSNVALIYVAWHVYGDRISDRFMKPATSAAVEELKKSVSRLKLPKEHSPRV